MSRRQLVSSVLSNVLAMVQVHCKRHTHPLYSACFLCVAQKQFYTALSACLPGALSNSALKH